MSCASSGRFALVVSLLQVACLMGIETTVLANTPVSVRVAVSLDPPQDRNAIIINPTLRALEKEFGKDNLCIKSYALPELEKALESAQVDVFISTSGLSRRMAQNGARDLVTMVSDRLPDPNHAYGTLFITRRDSGIDSFVDMKGKVLAANMPGGFYGYQIALGEIIRRGYDPKTFFTQTIFVGRDLRAVVDAVISGRADVGTLSSCFLEDTYPKDSEVRKKILPIGVNRSSIFPCLTSTKLYPNWSVSTMPSTSAEVSKRVTQALLTMPSLEGGMGWSIATDFSSTDRLFRELQVGPFGYLKEWLLTEFARTYWQWAALVVGVGVFLFFHSLLMSCLVKRRTKALSQALQREIELKRATDMANEKLQTMGRVLIVNQLGALIAHEIRQPLAAIEAYAHGTQRFLEEGKIDAGALSDVMNRIQRQTSKAEKIIDRVRVYARQREAQKERIELNHCVNEACTTFVKRGKASAIDVRFLGSGCEIYVLGSAMELVLAVDNLLRNAVEALQMAKVKKPKIVVTVVSNAEQAQISVTDNGPRLSETEIDAMRTPMHSTKKSGLGLGLQVVSTIAGSFGGELVLIAVREGGLQATIRLPLHVNLRK